MFKRKGEFEPFVSKVWLASPTMHGIELEYIKEAYETNWMSTVGANINEVERIAAEKAGVKHAVALSCCTAALYLCVKFAGEKLYGKTAIGHGALLIEDAAESMGATWDGVQCGTYGDYAAVSYNGNNVFETEVKKFDCKESTKMAA